MCIFPVKLSLTEATMRQVPQRMTCRSAHLCSCDLPFRTLKTPFSRVRSCWSALAGHSGGKKSTPQTGRPGGTGDVSAEPHPSCGKQIRIIITKCPVVPPLSKKMSLHRRGSAFAPDFNEPPFLFNSRTDLTSACRTDTALLSHMFYSWIHLAAQE